MPKPTYEFLSSPHFSEKTARKINCIVIHHTGAMTIESTLDWFRRREAKVSAHYVVGRDGRVVQMVKDEDIAWHAGRSAMRPALEDHHPDKEPNVNQFSLGIELVGDNDSGFTDRQLASLYSLLEVLVARYKIPPERVVGHAHIAPGRKTDPDGYQQQFPWARARAVAQTAYNAAVASPLPG